MFERKYINLYISTKAGMQHSFMNMNMLTANELEAKILDKPQEFLRVTLVPQNDENLTRIEKRPNITSKEFRVKFGDIESFYVEELEDRDGK